MAKRRKNPKGKERRKKPGAIEQEAEASATAQAWQISYPDANTARTFSTFLETHPQEAKGYPSYERDVTENPFAHARIRRLHHKEYSEDTYRWAKANLRVVYQPMPATRIIWNLAIGTATSIEYKKRSHR